MGSEGGCTLPGSGGSPLGEITTVAGVQWSLHVEPEGQQYQVRVADREDSGKDVVFSLHPDQLHQLICTLEAALSHMAGYARD